MSERVTQERKTDRQTDRQSEREREREREREQVVLTIKNCPEESKSRLREAD